MTYHNDEKCAHVSGELCIDEKGFYFRCRKCGRQTISHVREKFAYDDFKRKALWPARLERRFFHVEA